MKKTFLVYYFPFLISIQFLPKEIFSQNVGIGIFNPTRAKLELHGAVGSTTAIFGGETTGISMQSNFPGIGFNEYDNSGLRYIANGYGALQYFNPANGYMTLAMLPNGIKDGVASTSTTAMIISNTGNIGIKTDPINASLYAVKGTNFDGSAVFGGTDYRSHFSYSTTEDTYIRGGKNGSTVFINDVGGGNVQIGNGSSKVGINTLPYPPATALEINGGLSLRTALISVAGNGTVAVGDRSFIVVFGTTPTPNVIYLGNGISAGQLLILMGDAANQTVAGPVINDGANLDISGQFRFAPFCTITLIWTGSKWVELSRANNT